MAPIDPEPALRPRCRRGTGYGILHLAFALGLVAVPASGAGARFDVRVVADAEQAPQEVLLAAMRSAIGDERIGRIELRVGTVVEYARLAAARAPAPQLVVSVGVSACKAVLEVPPPAAVLCAFLPRASYDALREQQRGGGAARTTALYVDQPALRQLRLLRLALPQARQVGIVLGPDSRREETRLRDAAAVADIGLDAERIRAEHELVPALRRVLERADALLAVPDRLVFNRHTAQNVLLAAWRRGRPVMGYSGAYVDAGALLAVFSTPEQVGRQLGETVAALAAAPQVLPEPQYPRYYSVSVNARAARSLGLRLPPPEWLAQRLAEVEDNGP